VDKAMIEMQSDTYLYLGENNTVRFEDGYERMSEAM
jgi:hypothetical protein